MTEEDTKTLLWIRALERNDACSEVFSQSERNQARKVAEEETGIAKPDAARLAFERELSKEEEAFVLRRAQWLWDLFSKREPRIAEHVEGVRCPSSATWGICLIAFGFGVLANEIDSGRRLNLLAFPLMGMTIWNLFVYLVIAFRSLSAGDPSFQTPFSRFVFGSIKKKLDIFRRESAEDMGFYRRTYKQFFRKWMDLARPMLHARVQQSLHIAAALMAVGVMVSMYVRGISVEYTVGWESTFLSEKVVREVISVYLYFASVISGTELPSLGDIRMMHWGADTYLETNAGKWIHLFTITAILYVVVPRLMLAYFASERFKDMGEQFPYRLETDSYFAELLRELVVVAPDSGRSSDYGAVVVIPYAVELMEGERSNLELLINDAMAGKPHSMKYEKTVSYGQEEPFFEKLEPDCQRVIIVFNLSSTPEVEIHGDFLKRVNAAVRENNPSCPVLTIIDVSRYKERFSFEAQFQSRFDARFSLWKQLAESAEVHLIATDLHEPNVKAWIEEIERVEEVSS